MGRVKITDRVVFPVDLIGSVLLPPLGTDEF